jgi:hypothetical protein
VTKTIKSFKTFPPVRCEFFPDGRNMTYVGHANEEATKVDGFDDKGSFQVSML